MIDRYTTIAILKVLRQCAGYAIPEETLYMQVNLNLPKPATLGWIREHIQHAKDKGWAVSIADEIDGSEKWTITEPGKIMAMKS